jgi:hypothetical protein
LTWLSKDWKRVVIPKDVYNGQKDTLEKWTEDMYIEYAIPNERFHEFVVNRIISPYLSQYIVHETKTTSYIYVIIDSLGHKQFNDFLSYVIAGTTIKDAMERMRSAKKSSDPRNRYTLQVFDEVPLTEDEALLLSNRPEISSDQTSSSPGEARPIPLSMEDVAPAEVPGAVEMDKNEPVQTGTSRSSRPTSSVSSEQSKKVGSNFPEADEDMSSDEEHTADDQYHDDVIISQMDQQHVVSCGYYL